MCVSGKAVVCTLVCVAPDAIINYEVSHDVSVSVFVVMCWSITGRLPDMLSKTLKLTHPRTLVLKWAERLKQKKKKRK